MRVVEFFSTTNFECDTQKDLKMVQNHEIHGIDVAVCVLMHHLDIMFAHRVQDWKMCDKGINFEVVCPKDNEGCTRIHIAGYKSYLIECTFVFEDKWKVKEGLFTSDYPITELQSLYFTENHGLYSVDKVLKGKSQEDNDRINAIISRERTYVA